MPAKGYALMKGQKGLRKGLLLELYRHSRGDLTREVSVEELASSLNEDEEAVILVVRQLAEKRWLTVDENPYHTSSILKITMSGVEEAERLDKPFHQRWPSEHPLLFGFLMSVVTGVVMLLLGRLINRLF
jgi:hypothetical protein